MPRLAGDLLPKGALVAIEVGLSRADVQQLRNAGRPIPATVSLHALLDTGAECTCVDPQAVATLSLPMKNIGLANIPAVGGLVPTVEYEASLSVVHPSGDSRLNLVIGALLVAELPLAGLGYRALIGRDVLLKCRFLYDGPRARFQLAYRSRHRKRAFAL